MIKHFETLASACIDGGRDAYTTDNPEHVTCPACVRELVLRHLPGEADCEHGTGCDCYEAGRDRAWVELETHVLDARHGLDCRACTGIMAIMIRFLSTPEVR